MRHIDAGNSHINSRVPLWRGPTWLALRGLKVSGIGKEASSRAAVHEMNRRKTSSSTAVPVKPRKPTKISTQERLSGSTTVSRREVLPLSTASPVGERARLISGPRCASSARQCVRVWVSS